MTDEWHTETVSDLQRKGILLVEDGNHGEYRPRPDEFVEKGVAFIRAADMDAGKVLFESAAKINERARKRITKGIGAPGDVLLSHKGTVGKIALVPHDAPAFVCSPQTTFWRALDEEHIDRKYLYAFLRSPAFRAQLATRSGETDMAPYISLTSQRGLSVILPPIGTQRAIARILGSLDDKIEANRRMNETLEALARTIFKSWFVDFDPVRARAEGRAPAGMDAETAALFPDSFEETDLGMVPRGWKIGIIEDLAEVFSGKRPDVRYYEASPMALVPLWGGNGPMGFVPTPLIDYPILLTGRVGTLGSVFRIETPCWPSDNTLILKAKDDRASKYLFFQMKQIDFNSLNRGSTQPLLTQTDLKSQPLVLPLELIMAKFDSVERWLFKKIDALDNESRTIAQIRDTLLPRLISGELKIMDAGNFINGIATNNV